MKKYFNKYSYKDIANISENLGMLYKDGLQVSKAIELLLDFPMSNRYMESIKEINYDVKNGRSLYDSFSKHNKIYPSFFLSLLKTGEESGRIYEVLVELSRYYNKKDVILRKIVSSSIYPIFLIIMMISIVFLFFLFIVPSFKDIFNSFGSDIPTLTKGLLKISDFLNENFMISMMIIILWGGIIPFLLFKENMKRLLFKSIKKTKLYGELQEVQIIMTLSVLLSSGINIIKGIEDCIRDSNSITKEIYKNLNYKIKKGHELSNVIRDCEYMTNYSIAMIELGEESGSLNEILNKLTNVLWDKYDKKIEKILELIQPIMIIAMTGIVLIFIVIFVVPLIDSIYGGIVI